MINFAKSPNESLSLIPDSDECLPFGENMCAGGLVAVAFSTSTPSLVVTLSSAGFVVGRLEGRSSLIIVESPELLFPLSTASSLSLLLVSVAATPLVPSIPG